MASEACCSFGKRRDIPYASGPLRVVQRASVLALPGWGCGAAKIRRGESVKLKQVTVEILGREYTAELHRCMMCDHPVAVVRSNQTVVATGHASYDMTELDGYLQAVLPPHVYDALNFALENTDTLN